MDEKQLKRLAKEQRDAKAQYNLGVMYAKGDGVVQDYREALKWYTKAAQQGFPPAQYALGLIYGAGLDVSQDYVMAHKWFNLAAAQGLEDARKARDMVAQKMTPDQIAEAQRLAREWKKAGQLKRTQ